MIASGFRGVSRSFAAIAIALAILAQGPACTPYLGTTSTSFLRHARSNPDPNLRYLAYSKLGSPELYDDDREKEIAVDFLIKRYQEGREPIAIRAMIIRSLGNLRADRAREVVLKAVGDSESVLRIEGCRALGKVGRPEDATTLARVMATDTLEDGRIAAIEALGVLKNQDPRILVMLVDGMENDDPAIRLECVTSLRAITGADHGLLAADWRRALGLSSEGSTAQVKPAPIVVPATKPGPFARIASAAAKSRAETLQAPTTNLTPPKLTSPQ